MIGATVHESDQRERILRRARQRKLGCNAQRCRGWTAPACSWTAIAGVSIYEATNGSGVRRYHAGNVSISPSGGVTTLLFVSLTG